MVTYAIGDVQGCFDGLMSLLDAISFNPKQDELIFLGDVVNRGDKSLQTLEFIVDIDAKVVLGNHDYHLLACYFKIAKPNKKDTFIDILNAKNSKKLMDFLLSRDIVLSQNNNIFVHAGIPPIFDNNQLLDFNKNIKENLVKNPEKFIKNTYGNQNIFNNSNDFQYLINAFMRMRFCKEEGELEFAHKQNKQPSGFKPWFEFESKLNPENSVYFGHWSALSRMEYKSKVNIYPMDTGYIWGGELSAIRLEGNKILSIKNNTTKT